MMDDHAVQSEINPSLSSFSQGEAIAVTPPIEPQLSIEATEREYFRRVSDTLEVLQSNIDSHMRDIEVERINANDVFDRPASPGGSEPRDRPASLSLSSDSSLPALPSPDEDQLLPHALYQSPNSKQKPQSIHSEAPRSTSSSPDPFQLPIMQFDPLPATPRDMTYENMSKQSDPGSFGVPMMHNMTPVQVCSSPMAVEMTSALPRPDSFELDAVDTESPSSTRTKPTTQCPEHNPLRHHGSVTPHDVAHNPLYLAPRLCTKTATGDCSSVCHDHCAAPHTPPNPYPREGLLQIWPLQQTILVGIPVDQLRSIMVPTSQQQRRVPPWIALTEQGVLMRDHPPLEIDGSLVPISQVQWHPSPNSQQLTSSTSPHAENAAGSVDINISPFTLNSPIETSTNQPGLPSTTVHSISSSSPAEVMDVCYQLAFIAPEDFPGLTMPSESMPSSARNQAQCSSSNYSVFSRDPN